jgi:mono/diheme cytochrome c family protein
VLVIDPPSLVHRGANGIVDRELIAGLGGIENPEHAPNGPLRGLDNWFSFSQGDVRFREDAPHVQSQRTPAHGQWGITMDDWGRLFYVPNSDALRGDAFPKHYASRHPFQGGFASINEQVAGDTRVWPARATPGVNRGYQPDILAPNGRLARHTAACSPAIYRSAVLGEGIRGSAFVCEPAAFMVRRLALWEEDGVPRAKNAYDHAELLTSTDERFRPVALAVGPDGAIYIADMYRGVIQHKTYLTPYLKAQIAARALETPLAMGRIWRIVPRDRALRAMPRMSKEPSASLVPILNDADGWWRDTAQRLLVERRATEEASAIRTLARTANTPWGRLHAWWTLEGLGVLTIQDALGAAQDESDVVVEAGARLLEGFVNESEAFGTLSTLCTHPSRRVRIQALLSIGASRDERIVDFFSRVVARAPDDPILRAAAISGLSARETEMLSALARSHPKLPGGLRGLVSDLCDCVLRSPRAEMKSGLTDLAGEWSATRADFAGIVTGRLRAAQNLSQAKPRPIALHREPTSFIAASKGASPLAASMAQSLIWMDWPGRPHIDRGPKIAPLTPEQQALFERGREVFQSCTSCHGTEGRGAPGQVPPLPGSPRLLGPNARAVRILLHGMDGSLERDGVAYNGQMPASLLSSADLAAVLTFARRSWGNAGDPISIEGVSRIRRETGNRLRAWTVGELDALPETFP